MKKICLLYIFICVCFSFGACNRTTPEKESVLRIVEPEATIERVDFSVTDDAGLPVALIYYDKPFLLEGSYAYEEINAYFDEEYNNWKNSDKWSDFLEDVATGRETWGDEDMEIMPYVNTCQTKVMFADDERISILQIKYWQTAGPESCSYFGHTFDLKTGKLLSLDEIIDLDIDSFQAMISDALKENQDYLTLTPEQLDEPVNPPYEYYYDGEYVYIIFNEGIFIDNGCILKWNQKYGEECVAVFLNYYNPSKEDWKEFYYEMILTDLNGQCDEHADINDPECEYSSDLPIGYFYVDADKIYMMSHEIGCLDIFNELESFPTTEEYIAARAQEMQEKGEHNGYFGYQLVCSWEGKKDTFSETNNYHEFISSEADERHYNFYPEEI